MCLHMQQQSFQIAAPSHLKQLLPALPSTQASKSTASFIASFLCWSITIRDTYSCNFIKSAGFFGCMSAAACCQMCLLQRLALH
jgi:hypothetical protein